jgi:ribonuclease HI
MPALFSCEVSRQAWQTVGLEAVIMSRFQQGLNVKDTIHVVCANEEKMTAGLFATVVWVLWNNRNNRVWNDVSEPGRNLGFKAKQMWQDWYAVQRIQAQQQQTDQQQQHGNWQVPPHGWFKCNVDAGFHKELNKTSAGWCLRDHLGRFITVETTWIDGCCSIVEGESLALLKALHAMEQKGLTHVIMETDSKSVVDAICNVRGGSFLSQINNILLCNPNFKVKFIKRQANMVAHTLARAAIA